MQRLKDQTAGTTPSLKNNNTDSTEQKEDLLIRDLFHNGTDSVQGMRVLNTEDKSYLEKTPEKCL